MVTPEQEEAEREGRVDVAARRAQSEVFAEWMAVFGCGPETEQFLRRLRRRIRHGDRIPAEEETNLTTIDFAGGVHVKVDACVGTDDAEADRDHGSDGDGDDHGNDDHGVDLEAEVARLRMALAAKETELAALGTRFAVLQASEERLVDHVQELEMDLEDERTTTATLASRLSTLVSSASMEALGGQVERARHHHHEAAAVDRSGHSSEDPDTESAGEAGAGPPEVSLDGGTGEASDDDLGRSGIASNEDRDESGGRSAASDVPSGSASGDDDGNDA